MVDIALSQQVNGLTLYIVLLKANGGILYCQAKQLWSAYLYS